MPDLSPRFGQTFLAEGGGSAELYVNENAVILETMTNLAFADRDLATPPGSPTQGVAYLVAASGTGAWSGQDGKLTIWTGTRWVFITALEGFKARVLDENIWIRYDGSSWSNDAALDVVKWRVVRVATTANVTLSSALENGDTIDGVTLATGDLVLVKNQSTASQNGIYVVPASGTAARDPLSSAGAQVMSAVVLVSEGSTNARGIFINTNSSLPTVGSTSLTYAPLPVAFFDLTVNLSKLIGSAMDGGRLLFCDGTNVIVSDKPPGSNYVPYWNGSTIAWDAYTP